MKLASILATFLPLISAIDIPTDGITESECTSNKGSIVTPADALSCEEKVILVKGHAEKFCCIDLELGDKEKA